VLARAAGLDMVQAGWKPTDDNYLGRVTNPRILEAVREAKGEASARLIDHLKKADMVREADRLLDGARWLPEPLRLAAAAVSTPEQDGDAGPLPQFLADDEDKTDDEDEEVRCIAAE
jgi:ParB family transcriptional regulator, chromosome partitioning protein